MKTNRLFCLIELAAEDERRKTYAVEPPQLDPDPAQQA